MSATAKFYTKNLGRGASDLSSTSQTIHTFDVLAEMCVCVSICLDNCLPVCLSVCLSLSTCRLFSQHSI